jgi:hypothetical protein
MTSSRSKQRAWLSALLAWLGVLPLAWGQVGTPEEARFTALMEKIEFDASARREALLAEHLQALGKLERTAREQADLTLALAAKAEQDRLKTNPQPSATPSGQAALAAAQRAYSEAHAKDLAEQARQAALLKQKYREWLTEQVQVLTRQGKYDAALATRQRLEALGPAPAPPAPPPAPSPSAPAPREEEPRRLSVLPTDARSLAVFEFQIWERVFGGRLMPLRDNALTYTRELGALELRPVQKNGPGMLALFSGKDLTPGMEMEIDLTEVSQVGVCRLPPGEDRIASSFPKDRRFHRVVFRRTAEEMEIWMDGQRLVPTQQIGLALDNPKQFWADTLHPYFAFEAMDKPKLRRIELRPTPSR